MIGSLMHVILTTVGNLVDLPKMTILNSRTSNPVLGASDFGAIFGAEKTVKGRNGQCLSMVDCDS